MKPNLFSTREVATAFGVSESTVRRWCDQKRLESIRSVGGHRKVPMEAIIRFARETGHTIQDTELLGIAASKRGHLTAEQFAQFIEALTEGDATYCQFVITSAYMNGKELVEIFDELVGPAMVEVGSLWEAGSVGVDQERRACQIVMGALRQIESFLPKHEQVRGLALGCSPEGDFSEIGSKMAELILKKMGWHASQFGAGIPLPAIASACARANPDLLWLSIAHLRSSEEFVEGYRLHIEPLIANGLTVVVGGRVMTEELRSQIRHSFYGRSMQQFECFANGVPTRPPSESAPPLTISLGSGDSAPSSPVENEP